MERLFMMMAERLPTIAFILCRVLPCDAVAWVSMHHLAPVVGVTIWPADTSAPPYVRQVAASRVAGLLDQPGVVRSRGPEEMTDDQGTGDSQQLSCGGLAPGATALRTLTFNLPAGDYQMSLVINGVGPVALGNVIIDDCPPDSTDDGSGK
jgi:hypothetical protein